MGVLFGKDRIIDQDNGRVRTRDSQRERGREGEKETVVVGKRRTKKRKRENALFPSWSSRLIPAEQSFAVEPGLRQHQILHLLLR